MTDTSLVALHNVLFEQIDRLNDPELDEAQLDMEIKRADAMEGIAGQIVKNAGIMLKTAQAQGFGRDMNDLKHTLVNSPALPPERDVDNAL